MKPYAGVPVLLKQLVQLVLSGIIIPVVGNASRKLANILLSGTQIAVTANVLFNTDATHLRFGATKIAVVDASM